MPASRFSLHAIEPATLPRFFFSLAEEYCRHFHEYAAAAIAATPADIRWPLAFSAASQPPAIADTPPPPDAIFAADCFRRAAMMLQFLMRPLLRRLRLAPYAEIAITVSTPPFSYSQTDEDRTLLPSSRHFLFQAADIAFRFRHRRLLYFLAVSDFFQADIFRRLFQPPF